jgi:E3 ubiquitin-protein ligase BRE1
VELVTARNQALQAERKLRRNFYKLQAGLLTREQFVKDLKLLHNNNNDEDIDDDVGEWMQEMPNIAASNQLTPLHQSSEDVTMTLATPDEQGSLETHHPSNLSAALVSSSSATIPLQQQMAVSSQQLQQQQQQQQLIQDLQEKLATREESMQSVRYFSVFFKLYSRLFVCYTSHAHFLSAQLSEQLLQAEKRINILAAKQLSDTDSQKLETLYTTRQELTMARDSIETLQGKLQHTREQWAAALGNEEAIQQAMEEQQGKFAKKWEEMSAALVLEQSELIAGDEMSNGDLEAHAEDSISKANALLQTQTESQAKQIIILQHKLTQALENVRQAETTREELNDALALNETLHGKMEEIKSKYATMKNLAANNAATANSINNGKPDPADTKDALTVSTAAAASVKDSSGGGSTPTGGLSAEKIEKLHREHRRMRKDLSAMMASKEAAKIKLERAEKERDSLMEMNARLLKQMTEKDEMNAKSLSTILHLKSMTEQLALERDNLEQQAKSASQLALAARLATNAKDRVSEEAALEKHSLEEQLQALENKLASSKEELEKMTREWSEASGKMSTVNTELSNAIHRSDELVEELEKKNAEIRELIGNVRKAERKANECLEKLNQMTDTSGGGASSVASNFTAEQLNIQIGVLKSKLACPVCHYRDKECIIMRCRHLHCKQCVEDRISSRNRKCPTCNNKFSEKDVEDIWLNT